MFPLFPVIVSSLASDGKLTGYSGVGGINKKKKMLVAEGVSFKNNKVDLAVSRWEK
ncbi:MAG: MGMT family protein [Patescibacteria group bacterium]